jgi:hypothetical protein
MGKREPQIILKVVLELGLEGMLTQVTCPNCIHVGSTAAPLPRILVCSRCGHSALIRTGKRMRSPTVVREELAAEQAALERYQELGAEFDD